MTVFAYRARDRRGQAVDGVMEATDARAVADRLQRDAYFPVTIVPQGAARRLFGFALPERGTAGRVPRRDILAFTQQLAALLEAGMPLDRALAIQSELSPNRRLRAIIADVLQSVRGGASLADALATHHPRPFSRLYVNMVRAGEKGGALEATLRRLSEFLEESQEFRDAIVSALIYPALLAGVGAAAVIFLLAFVVPRFAAIFSDVQAALPMPTLILLRMSEGIQRHGWVLVTAGLAAVVAGRLALTTAGGRLRADRLLLGLPLLGDIIVKIEVARFSRVLGTLLRGGVALVSALAVVTELIGNRVLARGAETLGHGVRRGAGLAQSMTEASIFPPLMVHMVRVGEETGRLDETLLRVAAAYEADSRKVLKRLIALTEPCVILVMGLVVGFIVVAMLMAILSISDLPI